MCNKESLFSDDRYLIYIIILNFDEEPFLHIDPQLFMYKHKHVHLVHEHVHLSLIPSIYSTLILYMYMYMYDCL